MIPGYRYSNNLPLFGEQSHYNARIAGQISMKGPILQDSLSFGGRAYIFNPYHYLLAMFFIFIPAEAASLAIPILLGLVSAFFFNLLLERFKLPMKKRALIMLSLVATPAFIYAFSNSDSYSLVLALTILSFYFFLSELRFRTFVSTALCLPLVFFGFLPAFIPLSLMFLYTLYDKNRLGSFIKIFLIVLLVGASYSIYLSSTLGYSAKPGFDSKGLDDFFSDLGGSYGFGMFNFLLALIGLLVMWRKKSKMFYGQLTLILLSLLFLVIDYNTVFQVSFFAAVLAGMGFWALQDRNWSLKVVKNLIMVLIICGFLFSSISYIGRISASEPNKELYNALSWLKENPSDNLTVFSDYKNGIWVQSIAGFGTIADSNFYYAPDLTKRLDDTNTILSSRNLKKTYDLLARYNVKYILITPRMKKEYWKDENEGLLFLFSNSETFKIVYNIQDVEIWEFLRH
jgi:hypothetical protein